MQVKLTFENGHVQTVPVHKDAVLTVEWQTPGALGVGFDKHSETFALDGVTAIELTPDGDAPAEAPALVKPPAVDVPPPEEIVADVAPPAEPESPSKWPWSRTT